MTAPTQPLSALPLPDLGEIPEHMSGQRWRICQTAEALMALVVQLRRSCPALRQHEVEQAAEALVAALARNGDVERELERRRRERHEAAEWAEERRRRLK